MDVLRVATAGSVDDGKSTLIGRLLYETKSITQDKLDAIERASQRKGIDFLDLSLLTDGLIAEREQGITIDVAHIYFNTPKRKFIIADSPGHVEYTRNMVTGASKSEASLILIDARKGIVEQTYRHYFIANLLCIPNVIVCVNKMDLVDYSQKVFEAIKKDFIALTERLPNKHLNLNLIPLSSLHGDNLTVSSDRMSWYEDEPLLTILEDLPVKKLLKNLPFRMPVQYVIRPRNGANHDFRGYAGRISSGEVNEGDSIVVLPSGRTTKVQKIYKYDTELERATAKESITLTVEDDVDISRGDFIVRVGEETELKTNFQAYICWLNNQPLATNKTYLLQHGTQVVKAKVSSIEFVQDTASLLKIESSNALNMNEIAFVSIKTGKPIAADQYDTNPPNGTFILIDEHTNNTVAVGFIGS